jgi:phosphoribosylaminoimidazole carboxylase PurE protein
MITGYWKRSVYTKGGCMEGARILILVGSESDLPVVEEGVKFLREAGVPFDVDISSAHRNPAKTSKYASEAEGRGIEVIIAVAGMSAHLPGVVAAQTTLPVIGVPAGGGSLNGIDALLSIVQMPKGIPVATVGINAGKNAAILACRILSIKDQRIRKHLQRMKEETEKAGNEKSPRLKALLQE